MIKYSMCKLSPISKVFSTCLMEIHSIRTMLFTCGFFLFSTYTHAQQNIPLGTWRMHLSYNSIHSLTIGSERIFAAAQNGVMVFDREDQSVTSYSKLNGLTGSEITWITYNEGAEQLLVAYEDGRFDVIANYNVTGFNPTQGSTITGSKKINHISIHGNYAYLSTDYGVVVFDLVNASIKETWRDLGNTGQKFQIFQSTFRGDSVFLATEKGVMGGDLNNNLLDFNKWRRFSTGELNTPVKYITTFNNAVYIAINGSGIHHYENGTWTKELFLQGESFRALSASPTDLFIATGENLWRKNSSADPELVVSTLISQPNHALPDSNGKVWIADTNNGLVSDYTGQFQSISANGPTSAATFRMNYSNGRMFNVHGGYTTVMTKLSRKGTLDEFKNGLWLPEETALEDLTDVAVDGSGVRYTSSFGSGLLVTQLNSDNTLYTTGNSSMLNNNITALEHTREGLWVTNYGIPQSLHLLKPDNTWQSFPALATAGRYPLDIVSDLFGNLWTIVNPNQGGGLYVFNKDKNAFVVRNESQATGALPHRNVRSIVVDRDGLVWVGTELGVCYFYSANENAIKPIFESRFLLRDDKVTAIAVDGGNRKWMGTERGVWLFDATGEKMIYNFTATNSPLLSNVIRDIEIDGKTGEVFFITDKGICSFRSDATESSTAFQRIKIFPNPVLSTFVGTVGISGLATDATVKITDISGKLIWETQAKGGTATWNVQDYNGRRASTGIYLVFAATSDGSEGEVGKIAVVD